MPLSFAQAERLIDCHHRYGPFLDDPFMPSTTTVICTVIILIFTVFIEIVSHSFKIKLPQSKSDTKNNTTNDIANDATAPPPYSTDAPVDGVLGNEIRTGDQDQETIPHGDSNENENAAQQDEIKRPFVVYQQSASPKTRANRFVLATLIIIPITIAFAFRINETRMEYDRACRAVMDIAPPQWWAITLFNILPFTCACMAWLRTLVDCILVRYDLSLSLRAWPPAFPIVMVTGMIVMLGVGIRNGIMSMMGRSDEIKGERDIEMNVTGVSEEERGLMRDVDSTEGEMEDDERTAFGPTRTSAEGKILGL